MNPYLPSARTRIHQTTQVRASLWKQRFAFLVGACLQCNLLIGGNGEGLAATGGYGFRVSDFLLLAAIGFLLIYALPPRRVLILSVFSAIVGMMAVLRIEEPTFWYDPRTATLAMHYLAYSFSGLYIAIICSEEFVVRGFCWGLTAGLAATVPIFVLQDLGYSTSLVALGLVPGWNYDVNLGSGVARYSGLWGHPNEAGHIAALAGAAGAYFAFNRRLIPATVVAVSLVAVFYYTQSRGGLIAGASPLVVSLLFQRGRRVNFLKIAVVAIAGLIAVELLLQIQFIAYRFEDDPLAASNLSERFRSTWAGVQIAMANPLGLPLDLYISEERGAAGIQSAHNGFIVFAIVLGVVPFLALVAAFAANCRVRNSTDAFFFFLTLQVSVSCLFEQLPINYDYVFIICLLFGRAFLRTRIGNILTIDQPGTAHRGKAEPQTVTSSFAARSNRRLQREGGGA